MKKKLKIAIISLILALGIGVGGFSLYAADYYEADAQATDILTQETQIEMQEDFILLSAQTPSTETLIFYPGAKVEHTAYLPLLEKIRNEAGINVILVKMPFNMAIFAADAAADIIAQFPEIDTWYIGGHSMGAAMASNYAANNLGEIKALILLGGYMYGDYPIKNTLTVYGSLNTSVAEKVEYTENVVVIAGGNHAQFGNYGEQDGDAQATISREEQQEITVAAIAKFLRNFK